MPLFTDPNVVTIDDLLLFESTLVQVSTTHSIDVQTKINLAMDGIGDQLSLALLRSGFRPSLAGSQPLSQVLVTQPMYRWICFEALSRVFAEAYNVQLNTRFQGKMSEYQTQAAQARQLVYASPVGIVVQPLPQPAPPVITVGVGTYASAALFVQTAWVNASGAESSLSPVNASVLNGFSSVQISALAPGAAAPVNAAGWNVYLSEDQKSWTRQNSSVVGLGQSWTLPSSGLVAGPAWSGGQTADSHISLTPRLQRG